MSSDGDQQIVLKNAQLQAQLDAQIEINSKNEELIAAYKKSEARADAGAEHERAVYNRATSEVDFWKAEAKANKEKLEVMKKNKEKQMEVATAIALLTQAEKDYMARFVVFAADRNVFAEDDPLTNIFKGRKARGWSYLDTSIVQFIIEALASDNERFTLLIYHRFMAKLKAQEDARKAAMKRGLSGSAHSTPDPKKPKADEVDGVDFGDSTM